MIPVAISFALLGAIIGSFIGAVVLRWPEGRGVVAGRSSCDGCGKVLGAIELAPILSFLWQGGRCRRCGAAIKIDQLIAEGGCLIAGVVASLSAESIPGMVLLSVFGWALVALALLDARHHWLPDALTLPLVTAGIMSVLALPEPDLAARLSGAIVGYLVLEGVRQAYHRLRGRDGLGGGDPKLFAAVGAWLGIAALPWILLAAGLLGLLVVAYRSILGDAVSRFDKLPLGTLLAIAAIALVPFRSLLLS